MSEELKTCPFCGGEGAMCICQDERICFVKCSACGAYSQAPKMTPDDAAAAWNARAGRTCRFEPEMTYSYWDEDDVEHETDLADGECEYMLCSECGQMMHEAWFEFERQECGGLSFDPQFRFCPGCGAEVER